MIKRVPSLSLPLFLLVLAGISLAYLGGVTRVPFHPDESTQIYNSGELELFWRDPTTLVWRAGNEGDLRQQYRELDAPLTRNIIFLGRQIARLPALPVDWDWSKTWNENARAGALPSPGLLRAARLAVAALFPLTLLFFFLAARRAAGDLTAWLAVLLLAANALVLLHTRRAMAEGPLLFATTLTLWSLMQAEKRPWLAAIPAGLAFCAKQSLAALAPVGLLAVLWMPQLRQLAPASLLWRQFFCWPRVRRWAAHAAARSAVYAALLLGVIFLFNPFLWQRPIPAIQAALRARQELAAAQTADRPEQALTTPTRKLVGLLGGLYMTPPIFAEVSNYSAETQPAEAAYQADPFHSLLRSIPGGMLLLVLDLFGFALACIQALHAGPLRQRRLVLLLTATLIQTAAILALVPLPWQRYYVPLVPYTCLWAAYGVKQVVYRIVHRSPQVGTRVGTRVGTKVVTKVGTDEEDTGASPLLL